MHFATSSGSGRRLLPRGARACSVSRLVSLPPKLTVDRAKKLSKWLAQEVEKAKTGTQRFQRELARYKFYHEEQAAAGKVTRLGKHVAKFAPLLEALPPSQRALATPTSVERAAIRVEVAKTVAPQLVQAEKEAAQAR